MESLKHIQKLLNGLQKKVGAQIVILLETTGQILHSTHPHRSTNILPLTSLIVGMTAASQQLGLLLGEKKYPMLVQEGKKLYLLSTFITKEVILAIFTNNHETIGLVRFKIRQYEAVLKALIELMGQERQRNIRNPLADVTEEELDRLLGF